MARWATALTACALVAYVATGAAEEDDDIEWLEATPTPTPTGALLELNADTIDTVVAKGDAVLVEFYAPWCGLCKTIQPELERAAAIAANMSLPVTIARILGPENKDVADRYGVKSLPDFILFRGGTYEGFPALTTAEGYIAGLAKLLDLEVDVRPVKVFDADADPLDVAQWTFWRGNPEGGKLLTTTVLYSPPGLTGAAADAARALDAAFTGAAKELLRFSNLRFAEVASPAAMDAFEVPTDAARVVVYKEHDEGRAEYAGALDAAALREFVLRHDVPLVTTVWHRNLQPFRRRVGSLALFFATERQVEHPPTLARLRAKLNDVTYALEAKGLIRRGEFTLGIVDGKKYKSWLAHFELDLTRLPSLVVENTTTGQLYAMPDFADAACAPPVPLGYEPSPLLPADVQAEVRAAHAAAKAAAEAAVGADGSVAAAPAEEDAGGGFEHDLKVDPLTWVDVPTAAVQAWLEAYLGGTLVSHKTSEPISESTSAAAARAATKPRFAPDAPAGGA